ncbi:hypothetical protein J1N35_036469 [Gossypium stocksii]|uniref:Uncharacterized protein n=1 Tax=Gossypium stocksii TaxID=47602 RepID=A0A9D3UI05_9ROSI|nr:hypothetical protein J1N35_036469 [Gossypium stocksii]
MEDFISSLPDELLSSRTTRRFRFHCSEYGLLSAIILPNNKLHLHFSAENMQNPTYFGWQIELNNPKILSHHQPTPSTFFVKTLNLISVNYHLSNEAVSCMVSKFQLLENLKIIGGHRLESMSIDSETKLLSLTIFDCPHLKSLHIRSYKLRTFMYRGKFPWFLSEFHFNPGNAMLDSRQGPASSTLKTCDFDRVLLTIKNSEILTLCKWTFEERRKAYKPFLFGYRETPNTQRVVGSSNTQRVVDFTDNGIADYRIAPYRMYVSYATYH